MVFAGDSWLNADIVEFGDQDLIEEVTGDGLVYGLGMDGFGGPRWFRDGQPSAVHWLENIPAEAMAKAKDGKGKILFDMSNEGPAFHDGWMLLFHTECAKASLPLDRCVLLQQNRRFEEDYRAWAISHHQATMRCLVYDHFPRRLLSGLAADRHDAYSPASIRSKRYICLNYTPRPERTGFVSWLLARGAEQSGYLSYATHRKDGEHDSFGLPTWFPEKEAVQRGLDLLKARAPLQVDLEKGAPEVPVFKMAPIELYQDASFSIVIETEASAGDVVRITEKSLKPLAYGHPMIVLGNAFSLRILRLWGFETFPELFDESYDEVVDPSARAALVMKEVGRVIDMDEAALDTILLSLRPRLEKNMMIANSVLARNYKESWDRRLLQDIVR